MPFGILCKSFDIQTQGGFFRFLVFFGFFLNRDSMQSKIKKYFLQVQPVSMQFLCYVWLQKAFRANMLMISSGKFFTISTKINHNNPNIFETNFFFVDFFFIYFIRKTKFTFFCQFLQSFVKISLHRWFVSNALREASNFRISMWKLLIFFLRIKRKCRIDAVSSLWR